jgi:hypothetical protein
MKITKKHILKSLDIIKKDIQSRPLSFNCGKFEVEVNEEKTIIIDIDVQTTVIIPIELD